MFKNDKLADIYSTYILTKNIHPFDRPYVFDVFWTGNKKFKSEILQMLDTAINDEDVEKLQFCIAASFGDGLDSEYSDRFYKIILDTWHEEHEDIVHNISNLKDERFCEALFEIAMNGSTYRKFDDENESTLRKCVHALKAINTKKSLDVLTKLTETQNPNVQYALDMYK